MSEQRCLPRREVGTAVGEREPDYRFTLANERTFLAWTRTALALVAGGIAARQLLGTEGTAVLRDLLSLTCLTTASLVGIGTHWQWRRAQHAIRHQRPLPRSPLMPVLSVSAVLTAGIGISMVVLG